MTSAYSSTYSREPTCSKMKNVKSMHRTNSSDGRLRVAPQVAKPMFGTNNHDISKDKRNGPDFSYNNSVTRHNETTFSFVKSYSPIEGDNNSH